MRSKLIALACGAFLGLVAVELVLRATGMGFGNSPMEPDPFLDHVHPRNYTFIQQHPSGELGGFQIEYNDEGRVYRGRAAKPQPAPANSSCRVALMGDSFTEGGQVPFAATFAGLLEDAAAGACTVQNYGVRSYSPAIYLVQYTREVRNWKPTLVFVLLFGNDVREDVTYMSSSVRDASGWPTAIQGPSGGWLFSQLRQLYTARFVRMVAMRMDWAWEHRGQDQMQIGGVVEENPELTQLTKDLVLELNRRVTADGARLVVMVVPSRYRLMGDGAIKVDEDFHQKIKTWAAANGVEFLDLFDPFSRGSSPATPLFFRQDIHFTEEGHSVVAAAIGRAFPQQFPGWSRITSASVKAAFPADGTGHQ
jgi:lysophospholipase L1-like esterase